MSETNKTIKKDLDKITNLTGSVFTGIDNEVEKWLDPYVSGYSFIYWVQLPSWFEKDPDLKYFKRLSEINYKAFDGVEDISIQTVTNTTGFAGHETNAAGDVNRGNTDFSITHKEFSGGIMRKLYQKWISLIRDPRTGIATYPKKYGVDYGARQHSGQLLYIVVRPDVTNTDKDIIEYAAFYSNVFPTNIPLSGLYNYTQGQQDSPDVTINFKGFPEIGPNVEEYAKRILSEKIMKADGDSFMPFIDSYGLNTDAIDAVNFEEGPLSEIYKEKN